MLASDADILVFGGGAGGGKALSVETLVPTREGLKPMGEIEVGDVVYAPDGLETKVEWCSPVMEGRPCFEVVFDTGEVIVADEEHLWLTLNDNERSRLSQDDEWRAKRRASRPSRGTGAKPYLADRNRATPNPIKERGVQHPRTTREIIDTLRVGKRANHSIDVVAPIKPLRAPQLLIPPYLLGAWLGDGTTSTGVITNIDEDLLNHLRKMGEVVTQVPSATISYRIEGLTARLRMLRVLGRKHIPLEYLRGTLGQRVELLQGLMDTDGYARTTGGCEFTTTSPQLRDDVLELIGTLGIKAGCSEGAAMLYGREVSRKWRITFTTKLPGFRLQRKKLRQREAKRRTSTTRRTIVDVRSVPSVPVRCIRVAHSSHCFCVGRGFIVTHNTWTMLIDPLYELVRWPAFRGVLVRKTMKAIESLGGPWDVSMGIYPAFGAKPRGFPHFEWTFPSGAKLKMAQIHDDSDLLAHQGAQYTYVGFDEATQLTAHQVFYLLARLRTGAERPPYAKLRARLTCNPDPTSFIAKMIAWWVDDETGLPIPERDGAIRYMARDGDQLLVEESPKALREKAPHLFLDEDKKPLHWTRVCKSLQFIRSKLSDNPTVDPGYLASLRALDPVTRRQWLDGSWKHVAAGEYFQSVWFPRVAAPPSAPVRLVRYWDLAGGKRRRSDYTAGCLMGMLEDGRVIVMDMRSAKSTPADTEAMIAQAAADDGPAVEIYIEQEKAAAATILVDTWSRTILKGRSVTASPVDQDKLTRFKLPSSAASKGHVLVLDREWTGELLDQAQAVPDGKNDDQVDAMAGAWHALHSGGSIAVGRAQLT
jgi:predicted phage terminase large subunit-like protein